MDISVFIPTYNNAAFLPQAIESALAQTLRPLEIVVADDGSMDDTAEVVARYGDAVRYVGFDHCGVYAVRNAVLGEIRSDWFLNLDADNWIEPDFLEKAAQAVAESANDRLAFVYPDAITFGDYVREIAVPDFDPERFKSGNFVDMNSLVKTETARRFGFDPAFNDGWGDYDFFLTLVKHGYRGVPLRGTPLHYRVHAGSITAATKAFDRKQRLMRRIVQKHADFFSEEEGRRAIAKFAPEAVMRHRLSELWWAGRHAAAFRFAFNLLVAHPGALVSKAVAARACSFKTPR